YQLELFELIALDDVADLVFAEISELDSTFQTGAHFLHIILESPQSGESAVINRLAFSQHASASGAGDSSIGNQTTGNDALAQFENLFHFGMTNIRFAMLGIEQPRHRFFDLVEQFIDDAVKLDLHIFALSRGDCHAFNLD